MGALRDHFLNLYPYTDFHELNADWLIKVLMKMVDEVENFVAQNAIKYADPIQWNITKQYEKNTIVVDPITGTAYISNHPVPMGVALSNTHYWSVVFDLGRFITLASQNFANTYEAVTTTTATQPTDQGNWVVWDSVLYQAKNDIHVGDAYVVDGNIEKRTVEDFFNDLKTLISNEAQTRADEDARIEMSLTDLVTSRVNAEAQTRTDEDVRIELSLTDLITSRVNTEAQTRADEDVRIELELRDLIGSEVTARIVADQGLSARINELAGSISQASKYKGNYANVKELGAKGDGNLHPLSEYYGSLDDAREDYPFATTLNMSIDTAAIQKAVNTGLCFIPSGNYQINMPIVLPQPKAVSVVGEFRRNVYLTAITNNLHMFHFERTTGTSIFDISDVTFRTGSGVTGVTAIYFHGLIDGDTRYEDNWLTCDNCHFYDLSRGFDLYACSNVYVSHCYAVRVSQFAHLERAASFAHFSHILTLLGAITIFADDTRADGVSNGLYCYDVLGIYNSFATFRILGWQAVYIQNCSADFQDDVNGGYFINLCQDVTINGCWCAGRDVAQSYGMRIWDSYNVHVSDCTIEHFRTGMRIDAPSYCSVTVQDNTWLVNTNVDIQVVGGSGAVITGNSFRSAGNNAPVKGYSDTSHNIVTNNIMIGSSYDMTMGTGSITTGNVFI